MPVHDVARRGFDAGAGAYERARPSYPPDAVAWLVEHCGITPGARVCDLAAGTGKFTRLVEPIGAELVAVEPVDGMRRMLHESFADLPVVAATAEALPFAAESLDAVTVAQAFHWFDAEAALPELRRALRPGGRLGLIWNARERDTDWVDGVWSVMDRVEKKAPWRDHDRWSEAAIESERWFGPLHAATFRHEQRLSPAGVVERLASVSHVAVLSDGERARVLDEIRTLLATHPQTAGRDELAIPYRVDTYWCERLT